MSRQLTLKQQADTVRAALEKLKPQFAMALPKHLTPERLLRVTMTAVQNTPKLLECDRTSLFAAVTTCAQLGLEPDGVLGQAYLVPFKGKVQFIPGYKGYLTLARNSGEISTIQAHEVRENDFFDYGYGLNERLDHRPAEGDRGEITHFYAYAKFKDGGHVFEVMTRADVEAIRDNSEGYKAFKQGYIKSTPWESHFVQMGRKTVIRRLANYLPLSVQRAAALDAAYENGVSASTNEYGDVMIDAAAEEVTEEAEAPTNGVGSKLDALAGEDESETEGEAEPAPAAKKKAPAKKAAEPEEEAPKSRFIKTTDGEVYDNETGEIVPKEFVKFFEDGSFSILKGYHQQPETKPAPKAAPKAEPAEEDGALFGEEG